MPKFDATFRGANYVPSTARAIDTVHGLLPPHTNLPSGQFAAAQVDTELASVAGYGAVGVRVAGSFYAWLVSRSEYEKSLQALARSVNKNGFHLTFVLWSSVAAGVGVYNDPYELIRQTNPPVNLANGFPDLGAWFARASQAFQTGAAGNVFGSIPEGSYHFVAGYPEPGNSLFNVDVRLSQWQAHFGLKVDLLTLAMEYVQFVAGFFKNDPDGKLVDVSFDLFNELNVESISRGPTTLFEFVSLTYQTLASILPAPIVTMAIAGEADIFEYYHALARPPYNIRFGFVSFNYYFAEQDTNATDPGGVFRRARQQAKAACGDQCPIVCTEFFAINGQFLVNHGNLQRFYIDHLLANDMGGYCWGLLQSNAFYWQFQGAPGLPIDGFIIPFDPLTAIDPIRMRDPSYQLANDRAAMEKWLSGR